MTRKEYVEAMALVLSGDPEKVAEGNLRLFRAAIGPGAGETDAKLALVDAEQRLHDA